MERKQWKWLFQYPEGFSSTKLYLPVNQQVDLKMQSQDVIHSFWVPEFRISQDVVPGSIEDYRITPNLLGNYKVRCNEMCGKNHAYMESDVLVVSQADYTTWADNYGQSSPSGITVSQPSTPAVEEGAPATTAAPAAAIAPAAKSKASLAAIKKALASAAKPAGRSE